MNSSEKICGYICIAIVICTLIITPFVYCYKVNKVAFEKGYERTTVQGSDFPVWVKVKGE